MSLEAQNLFLDASFIEANTPIPDKDTEEEMARKIARQEGQLVQALNEKLGSETHLNLAPGVYIDKDPTSLTFTSNIERLVAMNFSIKRTVRFAHQQFEGAMQKALGINTPHVLFVQSHEDEETKDKLYTLLGVENVSAVDFIGTYYFFSPDGHFFKVASIPMKIDDDREDIIPPFQGNRYVRSKMHKSEFYGAHTALSLIREYLK